MGICLNGCHHDLFGNWSYIKNTVNTFFQGSQLHAFRLVINICQALYIFLYCCKLYFLKGIFYVLNNFRLSFYAASCTVAAGLSMSLMQSGFFITCASCRNCLIYSSIFIVCARHAGSLFLTGS